MVKNDNKKENVHQWISIGLSTISYETGKQSQKKAQHTLQQGWQPRRKYRPVQETAIQNLLKWKSWKMEDMKLWHARKHGRIYADLGRKHTEKKTSIQKWNSNSTESW